MKPPLQTLLENESVRLLPLVEDDFELLFQIASDPAIWEQHPNKDRYKRDVFASFFQGALESKYAFKIYDKRTGEWAGSTRYYDFDEKENSICIGYTFYATKFWGTGLNTIVKHLMLDYIFQYVEKVYFHVGANNYRSQKAVEKLGALKIGEQDVAYYNELPKNNFIYQLVRPKS